MAAATGDKAPGAFKTIGELSSELGVAQHILRYWETKFPQLRPLQRAGDVFRHRLHQRGNFSGRPALAFHDRSPLLQKSNGQD